MKFICIASLLFVFQAKAASYQLTNMGDDFKKYVQQYRNTSLEKQWLGWKDFEKKYRKYYSAITCNSDLADCKEFKTKRLQKFFTQLPQFEDLMWSIFDRADVLTEQQFKKFRSAFKDLPSDTPTVFMPSLLSFNGMGGVAIDGKLHLMFGVDYTALRKNNLEVLFSHELFHQYQFEKLKLKDKMTHDTLAAPMWFEGMATFVSAQLNPRASEADILMNEDLAQFCSSKEEVSQAAKTYHSFLTKKLTDSLDIHREWFSAGGNVQPARRGYCLGLQSLRFITKTHPLESLIEMDENSFLRILQETLQQL